MAIQRGQVNTINWLVAPSIEIGIDNLFADSSGVSRLSAFVISELLAHGQTRNREWVETAAGPKPENFRKINFTSKGLLVTFDEYEVDSYAAGRQEVIIPYSTIVDVLNPVVARTVVGH